jgi:hypothetical protein
MHIAFVQADAGVNGETYAHFDQSFTGFTVPAKGTANSGRFGNVLLTKGALTSLGIIPVGHLDVFAATTVTCVSIPISDAREMVDRILIHMRVFQDRRGRVYDSMVTPHAVQRTNKVRFSWTVTRRRQTGDVKFDG